ncbi:hypothetical protein LP421_16105 [Rhizobium sp. RCAM05350]|nr:hypothetical protein LP421_16105 [Rhizobium sp. RCAM05350]
MELKEPLAKALALFCKRAFIDRIKPFAEEKEGDAEAWAMFQALEELRLALKVAGVFAAMSYFGYSKVGQWGAGQSPRIDRVLAIVEYGQRTTAHIIDCGDEDQFIQWVSEVHDDVRSEDDDGNWTETEDEHLQRIGCSVVFRGFPSLVD